MSQHHILLLTIPAQSHINPSLQLAKTLTRHGIRVTFATTANGLRQLDNLPAIDGLCYASVVADGDEDDGAKKGQRDFGTIMNDLNIEVAKSLRKLVQSLSDDGHPVNFILYGFLLPTVGVAARELHIPCALIVVQCATAFAIYHKLCSFRNGIEHDFDGEIGPSFTLKLPGLPQFSCNELPTFLVTGNIFYSFSSIFRAHMQTLEQDPKPCVLVNAFAALEEDVIKSIENIDVISIGPLMPSAFLDGIDQNDRSFGGDLFKTTKDYLHFLNSKPKGSIVYISFGSLVVLKEEQKEEILESLLENGSPFLWALRPPTPDNKTQVDDDDEDYQAKIESRVGSDQGMIVPWCSQMEVLCHESIGCFFTHCGWNSTLESLVAGVPMLACPQVADQVTNAKMIEEVWGIGVKGRANEEGVVERGEIKRCLDTLMEGGEREEEIRRNTVKWRALALEAVKEGGSSNKNLKAFLEKLG